MVTYRPTKRRRLTGAVFPFPEEESGDSRLPSYDGPFRTNVSSFLQEFGTKEEFNTGGFMSAWLVPLVDSTSNKIDLQVIEEKVSVSEKLSCDNCGVAGWGNHPVSAYRYHFIIPFGQGEKDVSGVGRGRKLCLNCGHVIAASLRRCSKCGTDVGKGGLLETQSHLLHGVVHSNGFGHLLRINAQERGSIYVAGHELIGFWDRLCYLLRVRKISVTDVSKKFGLDFRLLHGAAYGHSWYGCWKYGFGRGSYGISQKKYMEALTSVRNLKLSDVNRYFALQDKDLVSIIALYQDLSKVGGSNLVTIGNLLSFILECFHASPKITETSSEIMDKKSQGSQKKLVSAGSQISGTTPPCTTENLPREQEGEGEGRLEETVSRRNGEGRNQFGKVAFSLASVKQVADTLLEIFKSTERKSEWLTRRELHKSLRERGADFDRLDSILRSWKYKVYKDRLLLRNASEVPQVFLYRTKPVGDTVSIQAKTPCLQKQVRNLQKATNGGLSRTEIEGHLQKVMQTVFYGGNGQPGVEVPKEVMDLVKAAQCILNVKQFLKTYYGDSYAQGEEGGEKNGPEVMAGIPGDYDRLYRKDDGIGGNKTGLCFANKTGIHRGREKLCVRIKREQGSLKVSMCTGREPQTEYLRVLCVLKLTEDDNLRKGDWGKDLPPELVMVGREATIGEFKEAACQAFRETYLFLDTLNVDSVSQLAGLSESVPLIDHLPGTLETLLTSEISLTPGTLLTTFLLLGSCVDASSGARFITGVDPWTVNCSCGTIDDDGERMVACDSCETWQHTACVGILDSEPPPSHFLCGDCN